MEAVIQTNEENIAKLQKMGVEIVCTDENAVIPSPFTYEAIKAEVRRYLHIYGSGRESVKRIANLVEDVVHKMHKALQADDGSLSWDEVWEIIEDCYSKEE